VSHPGAFQPLEILPVYIEDRRHTHFLPAAGNNRLGIFLGQAPVFYLAITCGEPKMNANWTTEGDLNSGTEDFAAELAEAAYAIMLRNASVENWLELKLELWRVLRSIVDKWAGDWPQAGVILDSAVQGEGESFRKARIGE
jgi:hypothetical protein